MRFRLSHLAFRQSVVAERARRRPALERVFRRVSRHRHLHRIVAIGAVLATGMVLRNAETARAQWGTKVAVVEMTRTVERGEIIGADDVRATLRPETLLRAGMSTTAREVVGRRATERLRVGDSVIRERTRTDQSSVAARLDPNERGVAIPITDAFPALRLGDRVSLIDSASGVETLGTVIDQSDRVLTIAINQSAVAAATAAVQHSSVSVVLRP